jgi:hypothetical protein
MVGKSKNRRRTSERFYHSPQLLRLLINVNRNVVLHIKGMEIFTFLPRAPEQFCLLSYWMRGRYLGISQRLSYTL